jgi:hypothetical protein
MFKKLNAISIHEEIPTDGHSPLRILADDFKDYIVKNDKGKNPPYSILNEIIANHFLKDWNIPVAEMALIDIDPEFLDTIQLSINHKKHFYNKYPAFASEYQINAIEVNPLIINQTKEVFKKIVNPLDVYRITLFDTWVENDDRKPTNYNLLLLPKDEKFEIIPIDNAFIFSTLSYDHLTYKDVAVSYNEHILVSDLGYLIKRYMPPNKQFVKNEQEYFYFCIEKCRTTFDIVFQNLRNHYQISNETITILKSFLFNEDRNKKVFEEYLSRINQ